MTTITSHHTTSEYDAEIAAQESGDLLDDMDALQANLRRSSFSSIPACDRSCRATFTRWHAAIIKELTRRGFTMQPQPAAWNARQRRKAKTA